MPASDEHVPDSAFREAILAQAVDPQIADNARAIGITESRRVAVSVRGSVELAEGARDAEWTVHLVVRHTIRPERKLFRVRALISRHPATGFNGFKMRGEAILKETGIEARSTSWTGLYNTEGQDGWS